MAGMCKADPVARRQALLWVLFGGCLGGVVFLGVEGFLESLRQAAVSESGELEERLRIGLILLAAIVFLPMGGGTIYLWKLGSRTYAAGEYPPPGCRLIRDTPVVGGKAAMLRACALKTAALALLAAGGLLVLQFWRLFNAFGS